MHQQMNPIIWFDQEENREPPRRVTDAEVILMDYEEIVERFQRVVTREEIRNGKKIANVG